MITVDEVRNELKEIRYYYSHKDSIDNASKIIGENILMKRVKLYAEVIMSAPAKLYELFYSLYVFGHTQQSLADQMCYTREYVRLANCDLIKFLTNELNKKEENRYA